MAEPKCSQCGRKLKEGIVRDSVPARTALVCKHPICPRYGKEGR